MKKYIVIMDWSCGTLTVFNNTGTEKDYGCNSDDSVWGYFDELPDFDDSLLIDSGESSAYLTIFDFSKNKGIIIPLTDEQHSNLISDSDSYDTVCEIAIEHGLSDTSDWMITDNDEVYFTNI